MSGLRDEESSLFSKLNLIVKCNRKTNAVIAGKSMLRLQKYHFLAVSIIYRAEV